MQRVIAYIDGFNLYFGLHDEGWKRYYWLDVQLLARNLLIGRQRLVFTKYFTTRISGPQEKRKRQNIYIQALETLSDLKDYFGVYLSIHDECKKCSVPYTCGQCGTAHFKRREKMTDVSVAVEMLSDAYDDNYDTALLISGDSDLVPAVKAIRRIFPEKRVVVAFPPRRHQQALATSATAAFMIGRARIAKSLLPQQVTDKDGYVLQCPEPWK